ncbi:MAG: hypothetical protein IPN87_10640 [Saprospiraceae bacterium]|jgi:hypothetical protein|nr:hypothetical protein [Candidatus Brachybacter algidus]
MSMPEIWHLGGVAHNFGQNLNNERTISIGQFLEDNFDNSDHLRSVGRHRVLVFSVANRAE